MTGRREGPCRKAEKGDLGGIQPPGVLCWQEQGGHSGESEDMRQGGKESEKESVLSSLARDQLRTPGKWR